MNKLVVLEDAEREFVQAARWYEEKSEGLGLRFIDVVKHKLELIRDDPERSPKRKGNFREAVVKIFPFVIIYVYYKKEKMITVNSIFHTSQNPRKKFRKKPTRQRGI